MKIQENWFNNSADDVDYTSNRDDELALIHWDLIENCLNDSADDVDYTSNRDDELALIHWYLIENWFNDSADDVDYIRHCDDELALIQIPVAKRIRKLLALTVCNSNFFHINITTDSIKISLANTRYSKREVLPILQALSSYNFLVKGHFERRAVCKQPSRDLLFDIFEEVVKQKNVMCVSLMIEAKIDFNFYLQDGNTPLMQMLFKNLSGGYMDPRQEIKIDKYKIYLETLMQVGASPNIKRYYKISKGGQGFWEDSFSHTVRERQNAYLSILMAYSPTWQISCVKDVQNKKCIIFNNCEYDNNDSMQTILLAWAEYYYTAYNGMVIIPEAIGAARSFLCYIDQYEERTIDRYKELVEILEAKMEVATNMALAVKYEEISVTEKKNAQKQIMRLQYFIDLYYFICKNTYVKLHLHKFIDELKVSPLFNAPVTLFTMEEKQFKTFLLGTHKRLGQDSPIQKLPQDILYLISNQLITTPAMSASAGYIYQKFSSNTIRDITRLAQSLDNVRSDF